MDGDRGAGVQLNRRTYIKAVGGAGLGFALWAASPGGPPVALAQIPGGTLDPGAVPKFRAPVLVPPAMPLSRQLRDRGGGLIDYYEISVRQFAQQVLPPGMPRTTLWGYGPVGQGGSRTRQHNAPSFTIETRHRRPVRVKWVNELVDGSGRHLPHLLPVDPTLHWANPPGGPAGRDRRPTFDTTPGRYTGPVPIVTHVHGAVGVRDDSDGYTEAWYLPDADDIPAGYAEVGSWYEFFAGKAAAAYGTTWGRGYATFQYPNNGRASTDWYHDHTLGMTRLNVYAGPAGFYLIRGGPAGDGAVLDGRTGARAVLPGPAPRANDAGRAQRDYREIALAIQDRSFDTDGSLFYPDTRAFFDGVTGPYIPETDVSPLWNPEFFGNMLVVNGRTWPYLDVEQQRYRFRVLNGCQSRFLVLDFSRIPGAEAWAIGNEGGFLDAPVDLAAAAGNRLLVGPAERVDLVVDFTGVPVGNHVLHNVGPDEPFGGGVPGTDFPVADPAGTGQVMQFRVRRTTGRDRSTPPQHLVLPAAAALPAATRTRPIALLEQESTFFAEAPAETLLGTVAGDPNTGVGVWTERLWSQAVTENPAVGTTEVWEFYNATGDAHPMHVHEAAFEVVNRQAIFVDQATRQVRVADSPPTDPEPWETGYKDTVIAYPGQVTRVKARFGTAGQYVWHCHIVEHEDNEMMRPYRVGPPQPGQPA